MRGRLRKGKDLWCKGVVNELRGPQLEQIICRDTKDVENNGQNSGGGERGRECTYQGLRSSIGDNLLILGISEVI